ncbi:acyl-CoA thioesterase [Saccharopolyspora griseoalba]|uniref:Acyl-CoA thioesterase n=1 Tax=Saccharopolyspora griseoalba TaxID=1431848 RepID=A0ABW2LPP9_9PSEU
MTSPAAVTLHHYQVQVTRDDLDRQGCVDATVYARWLHHAHDHLLSAGQSCSDWTCPTTFMAGSLAIDYQIPLRMREDPLWVDTAVLDMARTRVSVESTLHDGYRIYARGRSSYIAFSPREHAPRPLTSVERTHLRQHAVPSTACA